MNPSPTPSTPQRAVLQQSAAERRQPAQEASELRVVRSPEDADTVNIWARAWQWALDNTFLPTWWPVRLRHPIVGFALAALLEIAASLLTLLLVSIVPTFSFLGTVHMLVVAVIALTWGAAPSLLAALVGAAALEIIVLPQTGGGLGRPIDLVEAMVFLVVGTIISIIASNTERARRRAVDDYAAARARELALGETNARTDEFLSIASHELRSPLTSLKAALQLGQRRLRRMAESEQLPEPEDWRSQLDVVKGLLVTAEHQVDRQDRLVGDLLDVSRIRANKLEYHVAPCDLADIVRDTVDEQRLSWPDRTIVLDAPESAPIRADAHRVGQVVTNFLTNALKYSPPTAPVHVSLSAGGAEARVAVQDNGPGLTPEQQTHIWDRFHRVPGIKQQSGTGAGLGLGLHISRTIIEYHEGRVGIDSIPKNGSTFWFTLPLTQTATPEAR